MTSQSWLTTNEVDRTLWKHWINLVRPERITHETALLFISGGANNGKPPRGPDNNLVQIALQTKTPVAELRMVPNQPLTFAGDTEGRVERFSKRFGAQTSESRKAAAKAKKQPVAK